MYPKILRIECADKTCFLRLGHIIIWNKVPIELQQEIKGIPDGSVQDVVARQGYTEREKKRCSKEMKWTGSQQGTVMRFTNSGSARGGGNASLAGRSRANASATEIAQHGAETSMKSVKCYY